MKNRFTKRLQNYIFDNVSRMKIETLNKEIANCGSLTTTNCGWLEYALRDVIQDVLKNEEQCKREKAQSNKRTRSVPTTPAVLKSKCTEKPEGSSKRRGG